MTNQTFYADWLKEYRNQQLLDVSILWPRGWLPDKDYQLGLLTAMKKFKKWHVSTEPEQDWEMASSLHKFVISSSLHQYSTYHFVTTAVCRNYPHPSQFIKILVHVVHISNSYFTKTKQYTVIWGIMGHFLHFECVRKILKCFYWLFGVKGKETMWVIRCVA